MGSEKKNIEKHTALGFLEHYNSLNSTDFKIEELSEAPDIICRNSNGDYLNLEITLTEDDQGDITCVLGRSDKKSIHNLRQHLKNVSEGKETIRGSSLSGNVKEVLLSRIHGKLKKDYGSNVALVIRDTSGVGWDWETELPGVAKEIENEDLPYDKGIWLLNKSKTRLFKIL